MLCKNTNQAHYTLMCIVNMFAYKYINK